MRGWLRVWLPAILWAALIFIFSTSYFSAENTQAVFEKVLHTLFPSLSSEAVHLLNHYIRKTAHFSEYFVLWPLLFRGFRGAQKGWRWTWALAAFALAAGYSALDEFHQSFVSKRAASVYDSLLDSTGALAAMIVAWLWTQRRRQRSARAPAGENPPA